eukprot:6192675-Pleurochrysis_carterae.AAC.1
MAAFLMRLAMQTIRLATALLSLRLEMATCSRERFYNRERSCSSNKVENVLNVSNEVPGTAFSRKNTTIVFLEAQQFVIHQRLFCSSDDMNRGGWLGVRGAVS